MLQHLNPKNDRKAPKTMSQTPPADKVQQMSPRMIPLSIHAQYIKDLSFENPAAPQSLLPGQSMPAMTVNVTLDARKLDDAKAPNPNATTYEVVLHVEAIAKREQTTIFIVELDYATIAAIGKDVPEKHHHPLLMVEVPKLAFPFARQILGDVTGQAGFPPLLLNPVDFEGMYREQYLAQTQAANQKAI